MQKLDNRRAAYAMLPVGAENTITRRLSAPDRAACHFCNKASDNAAFNAGSAFEYKTAQAEIRAGRFSYGFFNSRLFSYPRKRIREKSHFNHRLGKADYERGRKPMFSHPKTSVPATAPMEVHSER